MHNAPQNELIGSEDKIVRVQKCKPHAILSTHPVSIPMVTTRLLLPDIPRFNEEKTKR
jgi:hypothetical protein